ncbi:MAG: glycosyltransferase family 1 protein [Clostridia bacterium]|nr:glycosyltransferase family 1 protein [Clostridia bacterium]
MIKILQVVSSLNINAGMMSVMMNYYRHMDRSRIQFDFLYFAEMEASHKQEILSLGGRVFFLGNASFSKEYKQNLKRFFDEHKGEYTAVHCHPIWAAALVGGVAKKSGVKHVLSHSHSTKFSEKPISAIRNRLMMPIIRNNSTELVACSNDAAKLFGNNKKVFVLHNAISVDRFLYSDEKRNAVRQELSIDKDTFLIGHVGRFSPEKNHAFMLRVFSDILKRVPDAKLLLVGDGTLRPQTEAMAKELSIENNVVFTGKRHDIPDVLSAMDVFWLPSLFEGVPLSVIEAQASGLPCVLSDTITREVEFGDCSYVSLADTSQWINTFEKISKTVTDRLQNGRKLLGGNYDIESETANLFEYYMNFSE